jgi:hypothetical protein
MQASEGIRTFPANRFNSLLLLAEECLLSILLQMDEIPPSAPTRDGGGGRQISTLDSKNTKKHL